VFFLFRHLVDFFTWEQQSVNYMQRFGLKGK